MDLLERIKKQEEILTPRFTRMDGDINRYLLQKYTFVDSKGKPISDSESTTMNDPRVFADKVIAMLGTAERRFEITVGKKGVTIDDCSYAEKFLKYAYSRADENLETMGVYPLGESLDFYSVLRGTIAALCLTQKQGDQYYFSITPVDPRGLIFEYGANGLFYGAIKAKMSPGDIEKNYDGLIVEGKDIEVVDCWTDTEHIVWVRGEIVMQYKHQQKRNPMIIVGVPTTPSISGISNSIENENESIYAAARDMYTLLNKHMSAWATQNMMGILPPLQAKVRRDTEIESPPLGERAMIQLEPEEGIYEIPIKDFSQSHQMFVAQIMARIQRATMANVEYGELSLHGLSALALKDLKRAKDQIFIPRLNAKNYLYRITSYRLLEQFIDGGYPTQLLDKGCEVPFDAAKMRDRNFIIKVKHYAEVPEGNIANMTLAANAKALGLPDRWIYEKQLEIEDANDLMEEQAIQDASRESTLVRRLEQARRMTRRFEKTGDKFFELSAKMLLAEIGYEYSNGNLQPITTPNPTSQPKPPLALQSSAVGMPQDSNAVMAQEENRRKGVVSAERSATRIA